jgi:HK97 family phage prohead protease
MSLTIQQVKGFVKAGKSVSVADGSLVRLYQDAEAQELGPRQVLGWFSKASVDIHGHVVVPSGIDITNFVKKPTIFWDHDTTLPIGEASDLELTADGLKGIVTFLPADTPIVGEYAELAWTLMKKNLVGFSIGFSFMKNSTEYDEASDVMFLNQAVIKEISVTPDPANADTVQIAIGKHRAMSADINTLLNNKEPNWIAEWKFKLSAFDLL